MEVQQCGREGYVFELLERSGKPFNESLTSTGMAGDKGLNSYFTNNAIVN